MRVTRRVFVSYGLTALGIIAVAYIFSKQDEGEPESPRIVFEDIATRLTVPWSLSFFSDDEALITERGGVVKYVDFKSNSVETVHEFKVAAVGEGGLLGVATRKAGRRIEAYFYYTYRLGANLRNRVVKTIFDGGLSDEMVIVDGIEGARIHDGGRIRFGPDGMLYITTGDAAKRALSQDINSLAGKILRAKPDGGVPEDNPFPNSLIYSLGNRNPQGIDWHPVTGLLYSTEHGPSGENGWFGHDEVNLIKPGGNYGWPHVIGAANDPRFIDPILHSGDDTWAPAGCSFHSGKAVEEWKNNLLFGALRGQHLHRVVIGENPRQVIMHEKLFVERFGRVRDVVEGPDGSIYILTSNRDGRGIPRENDDKIIKIYGRR